jgi:hypothetical protein
MTLSEPQRQLARVATAVDPPTAAEGSTAALAAACEHPDANPWAFLYVIQALLYKGRKNIEEGGPQSVAANWANLPEEKVRNADSDVQEIRKCEALRLPRLIIDDESESDATTLNGFVQYADIAKALYNRGLKPVDERPSGMSTAPYGNYVTERIGEHMTGPEKTHE